VKRDSFSVSITVGAYGSAFGAAAVAADFSVLQACLLSLLLFSGASQFAVVGVIAAGGTPLNAIATSTLLGTRNGLYGLRLAPLLKLSGWKRVVAAQITIDESIGVALAQKDEDQMRKGFWYTGFGVFVFWNLFTLAGALGAQAIGDPSAWGLDAAVPAAFCGLIWPRLKNKTQFLVSAIAIAWALLLTPIAPAGIPIITTVLLAVIFGVKK
jgi:predicted branched-subunit amino acid permease